MNLLYAFTSTDNYEAIKFEYEKAKYQLELIDKLHTYGGIPYCLATKYRFPNVKSGYTMGEVISVKVNGVLIDRTNNIMEYPKSCHYAAKHGHITFNFTKKDFRKYVELSSKLMFGDDFNKMKELLFKSVEKNSTCCKRGKLIFLSETYNLK